MHFATIQKRYERFRHQIALYADKEYQKHAHLVNEYDEYLYLPKSLKAFDKNMNKLKHFLTLSYDEKVYNIMMPTIDRYNCNIDNEEERKILSKFLRFNKVAKLQTMENTITQFWAFFEEFILKYKGVNSEQFFFYLKEAEFRFNYTGKEQREIFGSLK